MLVAEGIAHGGTKFMMEKLRRVVRKCGAPLTQKYPIVRNLLLPSPHVVGLTTPQEPYLFEALGVLLWLS
jgi:hypothetical protein